MASRVQRILRGELRWALPLGRKRAGFLCALGALIAVAAGSVRLLGFVSRPEADEPVDGPLPDITPPELAQKIRESLRVYQKAYIEAEFDEERNTNDTTAAGKDGDPIIVKFSGRFRYASDGHSWRGEYDSKIPMYRSLNLWPYRWSAGFDGDVHYAWEVSRNTVALGEENPTARTLGPQELFWSAASPSQYFLEGLSESKIGIKDQKVVDGYRCYVIESADSVFRNEITVSPRQSYLAVIGESYYKGTLHAFHELRDINKTSRGIWVPGRIVADSWLVKDDGSSLPWTHRETRVLRFELGREFGEDYFRPELPYDADIQDYRAGLAYHNDPWWAQVGALLRERFDWPPADIARLSKLSSNADPEIEGKDAPPIEAAEWVNGEPVDWEQLRGKVTLLYFSAGDLIYPNPQWTAALKRLFEIYKPAGLEMVGVTTSTDQPQKTKQTLGELRIPYPVAIDSPHEKGLGRTFHAFGLQTYTATILVDHEAKVHLVEQGKLIETLVQLLRQAGAKGVQPVSLAFPHISREMTDMVDEAWHCWVRQARTTAKITGKITDGHGPLPLADVEARLVLRMLISGTAGGWHERGFRDRTFLAIAEPDGSFALTGLCKGTYELKISAPGKAIVHRRVTIKPDMTPVSMDAVLDQADGIVGQVSDDAGEPIAGATVTIRHRHYDLEFPQGHTTYRAVPVVTDAEGRFRFDGLSSGAYTLDITADGYQNGSLEVVPAGTNDAEVRLTHS